MTGSRQQRTEDEGIRPSRTEKLWKEKRAEGTSDDMQLLNLHLMWRWSYLKTRTGGGENQASVVTGCLVISTPGLCTALGVNSFIQRMNRETWTPNIASTLTNLLTGSQWTRALPESMVNTGRHRTTKCHSCSTCGWAGAWLEWSVPRITRTHTSGGLE